MKRLILVLLAALVPAAAQPMLQPSCTVQSLAGTYSLSYAGWLTIVQNGQPMPLYGTILGVVSINYDGTLSGAAAVSGMGPVTDYAVSGTVEVHPDCVGKLTIQSLPSGAPEGTPPQTEIDHFIFTADTNSAKMLVTMVDLGPGISPAVLGTWERISRRPGVMSWGNW